MAQIRENSCPENVLFYSNEKAWSFCENSNSEILPHLAQALRSFA